ncbi:MAG: hypothetical protein M3Z50_04970 [Actinomycetota bacterium]|nr:hypothetical protein [Actinomycetota bacterium]
MSITDEKYMAFTTYRKTGEAVTAPVWVVPVSDGRAGFWTAMGSGKTKRLRNNPTIAAQPSDARGKIKEGTSPRSGTAELIQSGPLFDEVQGKIKKKYGVMVPISKYAGRLMGQVRSGQTYADTVVLVRLDG